MKIAFLNIYNGVVERGSEVFVDNIAKRLSPKYEIWVFQTGEPIKGNYKIQEISGIPFSLHQGSGVIKNKFLQFIKTEIYHLIVLLFTLKCLPYLWREKFDWIIPINGRWQVILCRITRFFKGTKILISGHAGVGFDDRFNLYLGKPDVFVALTPAALGWAREIYPAKKIKYIPNGVDLTLFNPDIPPIELNLPKPIIITVSQLLAYKRIDLLIKAVSKLKNASLLVIGDGPLKDGTISIGQSLLGDRFLLISHVSHRDLAKYYCAANLFSLVSESSEAFGLVYLEAMACGLPVVATDDKNRRELIDGAGSLVDPYDIENFAKVLNKTLDTDFGDKPRIQTEKFSWDRIVRKYEEIFKNY